MRYVPRLLGSLAAMAASLAVSPTASAAAAAADFTFTTSSACTSEGFSFSVRVQNAGPAQEIAVHRETLTGGSNEYPTVGDQTFVTEGEFHDVIRTRVAVDGEFLYDSGWLTADDPANCLIPLPEQRTDLDIALTATCNGNEGLVALTVSGSDIEVKTSMNGVSDTLTGPGPLTTTTSIGFGVTFYASVIDLYGRTLWNTQEMVLTAADCLTRAMIADAEVRCEGTQAVLDLMVQDNRTFTSNYYAHWSVNGTEENEQASLSNGATYDRLVNLDAGDVVDAEITFSAGLSTYTAATLTDVVAPDCGEPTQDTVPGDDQGSGGGAPTTAPTRGLPSTGRASGSVALFGVGLLLAGMALIAATRRRTA